MKIVTRFAPSPTGMLHIGGARTALFNYLFAKKNNGKFLLRIEDTDKKRSTQESKQSIIDGMSWLNLQHNGDIFYQSEHQESHGQTVEKLLKSGHAYKSYEKKITHEDGTTEIIKTDDFAVKIKVPKGKTSFEDLNKGKMEIDNKEIEDFVILRSDKTPTYMLAVVDDDHTMEVTHIIRGDDHISNTFKQIIIYKALGWEVPKFAHLPLIHDMDGKKLSKRKNAVDVNQYALDGYLSEAVVSYLMQLSWSPKTDSEILTIDEASKIFDIKDLSRSCAKFDIEKLKFINFQYIKNQSDDEFVHYIGKFTKNNISEKTAMIKSMIPELKKQKTINESAALADRFISRDFNIEEKNPKLEVNEKILSDINEFLDSEINVSDFKNEFKEFLSKYNYKFGQIGPIIRLASIGLSSSVDLSFIFSTLGQDEIRSRFAMNRSKLK